MHLTIAHLPRAPDALDPDAELLRPISGPGTEFLVVRRSIEPRVWLAPPHTCWLTTHFAFETAYPPRWREAAREAWLPVAFMNVVDVADGQADALEEAFRTRERRVDEQPGFLSLEVLRPRSGRWHADRRVAQSYVVFSRWASADAYAAWTRSTAFHPPHAGQRLPESVVERAHVLAFSVVQPVLLSAVS
jgi:heme-degrading monooxygenase HmoA